MVPITFAYDGKGIIGHTATGMKVKMMRSNPEVCFQVDRIADMANWQSVIVWGRFEELFDHEAEAALLVLLDRVQSVPVSVTSVPEHHTAEYFRRDMSNGHAIVYRINVHEKTGRCESV